MAKLTRIHKMRIEYHRYALKPQNYANVVLGNGHLGIMDQIITSSKASMILNGIHIATIFLVYNHEAKEKLLSFREADHVV